MIIPWLRGLVGFSAAPVTWSLLLLNVLVALVTHSSLNETQNTWKQTIHDPLFLKMNGDHFAQYISKYPKRHPETLKNLAKKALDGEKSSRLKLGAVGLRDADFLSSAGSATWSNDEVAMTWWRERVQKFTNLQQEHPNYLMGVLTGRVNFTTWLSYQFSHSGFGHLFGNMFFLLLFGGILEPVLGGLGLLVIYLGSGMVAAGAFLLSSQASSIPLVGASGSVSGLMAAFAVLYWRQPVRYLYFLFIPKRGYAGIVYLPAWVTLALWFASDLAGSISALKEFGGIAYWAHLGGEFAGALAALVLLSVRTLRKQPMDLAHPKCSFPPVPTAPVFKREA